MTGSDSRVERLRQELRQLAEVMSPMEMETRTEVSYASIYRFIREGSEIEPQKATLRKLEELVKAARNGGLSPVSETTSTASSYSPGPSVAKLGTRAREIVIQYLRRLEAAGLQEDELIVMERLLADRSFAQRFSNSRLGPLSEDDEILLIEDTWRTIADTLALRGLRP